MLDNLYVLGSTLLNNNRRLYVFLITYNHIQCNVVFHRLIKPVGYWTIELSFIKVTDNNAVLSCYANKARTNLSLDEFCDFFDIQVGEGNASLKDIFSAFYTSLNNQIPHTIERLNDVQRELMSDYIYHYENRDEHNRLYLYDLRKTGNRSEYNNDKAAARYPDIYEHFQNDREYSFYFSEHREDEVTLNQLLEKLRKRNN